MNWSSVFANAADVLLHSIEGHRIALGRKRSRNEHRRLRPVPDRILDHRIQGDPVPVDVRIARHLRQRFLVEGRRSRPQKLPSRAADALHRQHIGLQPSDQMRQTSL